MGEHEGVGGDPLPQPQDHSALAPEGDHHGGGGQEQVRETGHHWTPAKLDIFEIRSRESEAPVGAPLSEGLGSVELAGTALVIPAEKTAERIEARQVELKLIARTNEEKDEAARQAANIFFATRSYEEVKNALGITTKLWKATVLNLLSREAALKELDRLREQMRKRSLVTREDAALFLMRVLEMEPSKYLSTRTEKDFTGQPYTVKYVDFDKLDKDEASKYIDRVDWDGRGIAKGSFISKMDAFKRLCDLQGWDAPKQVEFAARVVDPRYASEADLIKMRDAAVMEAARMLVVPLTEQHGQDSQSGLRADPAPERSDEAGVREDQE